MLIVSPNALSVQIDARIDSGIEMADDDRVPPVAEEKQDHGGRQTRGDDRLDENALDRCACTKIDWSKSGLMVNSGGRVVSSWGRRARIVLTMSNVEATPAL